MQRSSVCPLWIGMGVRLSLESVSGLIGMRTIGQQPQQRLFHKITLSGTATRCHRVPQIWDGAQCGGLG